jgi:hypothetical protein
LLCWSFWLADGIVRAILTFKSQVSKSELGWF